MPLWSQGFKVCIHPPLTDESRIPLAVDDLVNVTRWRKHWLFGEKIVEPAATNGKKNHEIDESTPARDRTRGWFPRQCAEYYEDSDDDSDDDFDEPNQGKNKKKN